MKPDLIGMVIFAIAFIILVLVVLISAVRKVANFVAEARCPKCKRYWAAQKTRDQLLGIFRKGEERGTPDTPEFRMGRYRKYRIFNRCRYCGFEWTVTKSERASNSGGR